ncbi:MAG: ATP synthase subunit I [Polyangiaceae bacterium]
MIAVLIVGAVFVAGAVALSGGRAAVSVALGALLGAGNLWVVARVVRAFLGGGPRLSWTLVVLVKLALIAAVLYVIVRTDFIMVLPFALGWGALPLGIVFGGMSPSPALEQKG